MNYMIFKDHVNAYEEHRDSVNWAINRGIEKSQRIIGLHTSRAIIELLSAYLHKSSLIEVGFQVNHRWFKSESVFQRFPEFSDKKIIFDKIHKLELDSEKLIYGSQKNEKEIKELLILYNEIEKLLLNLIEDKDEIK